MIHALLHETCRLVQPFDQAANARMRGLLTDELKREPARGASR
jgi:hypothetical protein